MKILFPAIILLVASTTHAAPSASLKVEGTCSGKLNDDTPISIIYYSDFDGCKEKSSAAISLSGGREGLTTGARTFIGDKDIYKFGHSYRLVFKNSTGNTSGILRYTDEETSIRQRVELQCEVRDYEYVDC